MPIEEQRKKILDSGWTVEKLENRIRAIAAVNSKLTSATNIGKHLILWKEGTTLWLKLTDHKKGYWAEAPLTKGQVSELSDILLNTNAPLDAFQNFLSILKDGKPLRFARSEE